MRDPAPVVDPNRHTRRSQQFHAALALAGCRLVGDQANIDAALLGTDQRLDDARAGGEPIGADQDLTLGIVDRPVGKAAQSSSGEKQTAIAAPAATDEAGNTGERLARARERERAAANTHRLCHARVNSRLSSSVDVPLLFL